MTNAPGPMTNGATANHNALACPCAAHCARIMRVLRWLGWLMVAGSAVLAWFDLQGRWRVAGSDLLTWFKLWIYWGSWTTLPLLASALWRIAQLQPWRSRIKRALWAGLLALVAYSGLLEPRLLLVREHAIHMPAGTPPLRIALVGDLHVGLFTRRWQLERLVDVLNAQNVDAVVVAGDWTYEPDKDLLNTFAPLARLRHPVLSVLGNHDTEAPGPPLQAALRQALQHHGVQWLDGSNAAQTRIFKGWHVTGLSDAWGGEPRAEIQRLFALGAAPIAPPHLIIAHNPGTARMLPLHSATLIASGHTHGGQIWLPWVTKHWVLPAMGAHQGWFEDLYATPAGPLFVTAGTGMVGLPARLGVVPRVDVLTLRPQP